MAEPIVDVLEKKFDTAGWQTYHNGRAYKIDDLSRNDLLQLVCEGMQAVDMLERFLNKASDVLEDWHNGKIKPDLPPVQEIAVQCESAASELDRIYETSPVTKQAQVELRDISARLFAEPQ